MELFPLIVIAILIILLIIGAVLWTQGRSFLPDPDLTQVKEVLERIKIESGYTEYPLSVQRSKSFYTKDRRTIYLDLSKFKTDYEGTIRRSLHELAHCINRDASEHGAVFHQIEETLLKKAQQMNILTNIQDVDNCLTILKEDDSEERAHRDRLNYSMYFNPKTIY